MSLQKTDAPYETVAKALAPSAELTPYTPVGNLKIGNVSTLARAVRSSGLRSRL